MSELQPMAALSASQLQRAVAYGDGVFETMRVHEQRIPWLDAHWRRLRVGLETLGLDTSPMAQWREQVGALARSAQDGVLKLTIFAAPSGRGYARVSNAALAAYDWYGLPPADPEHGIRVHTCVTRWPAPGALSGIKHLNRLAQVLASEERRARNLQEGVMLAADSEHGQAVVCATAGNIFGVTGHQILIPDASLGGIAGVAQARLVECTQALGYSIQRGHWSVSRFQSCSEVFLANALRGVRRVAQWDDQRFPRPRDSVAEQLGRVLWDDFVNS